MLRERILAEGTKGTGKSHQWLLLARWLKPTGAKFRCIDTDDAIFRMLQSEFPDLIPEEGGNVYVHPVYDWPEYMEAKKTLLKEAAPDDWNIVDMADNAWKAVQGYFITEVFKTDIGDYFLEARKAMAAKGDKTAKGKEVKNLQVLKGWIDWPVVNKLYDDFMLPLVYRSKAHLYMTASVAAVSSDDSESVRELYGPLGVRPNGQKNLAHQAHTEFLFSNPAQGIWEITTVKDRGRAYFDHAPLLKLSKQYLIPVAGWR